VKSPLALFVLTLASAGAALVLAPSAKADPSTEACERALVSRIHNENRNAGRVDIDGGMKRDRKEHKGEAGFNGKGQWKTGNGRIERFNYACTYDHKDRRVKSVSYQRRDARADERARRGEDGERRIRGECQTALKAKLKKEHSNATNIELAAGRNRQASADEMGLRGNGTFVNGSGEKRHFGWDCVYDRAGRISQLSYQKPSAKK
jgi:hypothetical protein